MRDYARIIDAANAFAKAEEPFKRSSSTTATRPAS